MITAGKVHTQKQVPQVVFQELSCRVLRMKRNKGEDCFGVSIFMGQRGRKDTPARCV